MDNRLYSSGADYLKPLEHCRRAISQLGLSLGELLGCGDNGCVYAVQNKTGLVAKIHREAPDDLVHVLLNASAVPVALPKFYLAQRIPDCVDQWKAPIFIEVREDLADLSSNPLLPRKLNHWLKALDEVTTEGLLVDRVEAYALLEHELRTRLALPQKFKWVTHQILMAFQWLAERGYWLGDVMPDNWGTRGGRTIVLRDI